MTLDEVTKILEGHFKHLLEYDGPLKFEGDDELHDATLTMFSVLDYAKVLEDKFGSLEEAVNAEKVVHCWECIQWHSDKQYCERPYMGKIFCPPDYYCGAGFTRERIEENADKFNEIPTINPISPQELMAALERSKEGYWSALHGKEEL